MGELTPSEIEQLILGYEELETAERELADEYLGRHPDLARRLKWHQEKEAAARATLPAAVDSGDEGLSAADARAQEVSLRRILAMLDGAERSTPHLARESRGRTWIFRRRAAWALPLAAILALIIFIPRGGHDEILLRNLSVRGVELRAEGSRGPAAPLSDATVLHTGQAFALDFTLEEDAFVVVYHVDPTGRVSRVYPESVTETLTPHAGGRGHQIPDPAGGETWILGSETGTESFLLGIGRKLPQDLDLASSTASELTRTELLNLLRADLERIFDQVELFEFTHLN